MDSDTKHGTATNCSDEKGNIPAEMQKPVLGYDGKGLVYSDDNQTAS